MNRLRQVISRAVGQDPPIERHDRGASLVEYALLIALIAMVCVAAVTVFGGETSETFSRVGRSVSQT